jgi:hypothetical protein
MKMPVSVRIFSSFVVPVPGMEVYSEVRKRQHGYKPRNIIPIPHRNIVGAGRG